MTSQLNEIKKQVVQASTELIQQVKPEIGDIFVLGCSSSEVVGGNIGKNSSEEVGDVIVSALLEVINDYQLHLAVQGCEHINRALVVEREVAKAHQLEVVSVVPKLHAGGSASVAAFNQFKDPVEVEHITATLGMDIGDTSIGMHIKHVQVPVRTSIKEIGAAHTTFLRYRPKLIGGQRAEYK